MAIAKTTLVISLSQVKIKSYEIPVLVFRMFDIYAK